MNNPLNKEFNSYVSVDTAPYGSACRGEDCSKPALHYYLVTGGVLHGQSEFFCGSCGEKFIDRVEHLSEKAMADRYQESLNNQAYNIAVQSKYKRVARQEIHASLRHDDEIHNWDDYELWVSGRYAQ